MIATVVLNAEHKRHHTVRTAVAANDWRVLYSRWRRYVYMLSIAEILKLIYA